MSDRVADLLIETLQAAGVKSCYGIVGDTLNGIAHAIDRIEIDWVHMRPGQRSRRLGNDGGEHPLTYSGELRRALAHHTPPAREQADETGGQGATAIS